MTILDPPLERRLSGIESDIGSIKSDMATMKTDLAVVKTRLDAMPTVWTLAALILPLYGLVILAFIGIVYFVLSKTAS